MASPRRHASTQRARQASRRGVDAADHARAPWRCAAAVDLGSSTTKLDVAGHTWKLAGRVVEREPQADVVIGAITEERRRCSSATLAALGSSCAQSSMRDRRSSSRSAGLRPRKGSRRPSGVLGTTVLIVAMPGDLEACPRKISATIPLRATARRSSTAGSYAGSSSPARRSRSSPVRAGSAARLPAGSRWLLVPRRRCRCRWRQTPRCKRIRILAKQGPGNAAASVGQIAIERPDVSSRAATAGSAGLDRQSYDVALSAQAVSPGRARRTGGRDGKRHATPAPATRPSNFLATRLGRCADRARRSGWTLGLLSDS